MISAIVGINVYEALGESSDTSKNIKMWIGMVTIAPIFEELAFRLLLKKSKINYIVSLTLMLSYIFILFFDLPNYFPFIEKLPFKFIGYLPFLLLFVLLSFFSYMYLFKDTYHSVSVKKLLYATSILFAVLHFTNFNDIQLIHIILFPLLIAHHFVFGVLAGYLRLKLGLKWAVYFHGLNNMIAVFFMAFKHFSELYL